RSMRPREPNSRFSHAGSVVAISGSCGTRVIPSSRASAGRAKRTSSPRTVTLPELGRRWPVSTLSRFVLPDPFAPTIARTSPGATESETPSRAFSPGYSTVTSLSDASVVMIHLAQRDVFVLDLLLVGLPVIRVVLGDEAVVAGRALKQLGARVLLHPVEVIGNRLPDRHADLDGLDVAGGQKVARLHRTDAIGRAVAACEQHLLVCLLR